MGNENLQHLLSRGTSANSEIQKSNIRDAFLNAGLRLLIGPFQKEVLSSIQALGIRAYGTAICQYIEQKASREVSTPQVYSALSRLCSLGFVSHETDALTTAGHRGRPRKVYSLTTSGLRMLEGIRVLETVSQNGESNAPYAATRAEPSPT